MADTSNRPLIIIKKKAHGEHGHHGGAWKVAYADFVTAMMAFFLLLWLLNVTTDDQRKGVAQFFTPDSVSRATSGAGGVLGGTVLSPGEFRNTMGGVVMGMPVGPATADPDKEDPDKDRPLADMDKPDQSAETTAQSKKEATDAEVKQAIAKREEEQFANAEHDLKQAIQDVPELRQLSQNLMIDRTPEGLRIQIVDQGRYAMFALGSSQPLDHTRKLLAAVSQVVQRLPNKIAVSGHTDATPFSNTAGYSNWELSTDRANASRRTLIESGLAPVRVSRVVGKAEQEPLFTENPADPRNRRISIVLLREAGATSTN
ncbi:MAG: flagellar motor protein MotB [Proteobacteria bacterium]|nr:flagellar motor protein MotB [Pseudomonadota bacterium]